MLSCLSFCHKTTYSTIVFIPLILKQLEIKILKDTDGRAEKKVVYLSAFDAMDYYRDLANVFCLASFSLVNMCVFVKYEWVA